MALTTIAILIYIMCIGGTFIIFIASLKDCFPWSTSSWKYLGFSLFFLFMFMIAILIPFAMQELRNETKNEQHEIIKEEK